MDSHALLAREAKRFASVSRKSIREQITEKLAALIGSGVFSVGDPLPAERDLAAALAVSRETIRGALLILSTRGIVTTVQGMRTSVASDDVGDLALSPLARAAGAYGLDDVHEARLLVEDRVAALAAERIEAAALSQLDGLVEAQTKAAHDPVRFLILDREFHVIIYRAGGNAALADVATTLYAHVLDQRRRVVSRPGAVARSISDHRDILAALRAGDGPKAARAFGIHEQRIYDTTCRLLAEAGDLQQGGDFR